MTGLNSKAFNTVLPNFTEAYEKSVIKPEIKRKRAMGGGRKATLREMKDKLFYTALIGIFPYKFFPISLIE